MREKLVNSIKRKDFIPGEQHRVCSQHFHGAYRQSRSDVPIIFPLVPQSSKQRKPPKICLPLEPPAKRKKIRTGASKALVDDVEEMDFLCVELPACLFQ